MKTSSWPSLLSVPSRWPCMSAAPILAEAVAVMLFYQIGELFQIYAVGKSRRNISALMDIRPDYANIEKDGQLERVDPDEVEIGSVIVVQPGEKVPDGTVIEGASSLNTSALTGESLPRDVAVGDEIISGCINMTGVLKIRTSRPSANPPSPRSLSLSSSGARKSRAESFISRFARVYTPVVCYSALALAVLPPVIRLIMGMGGEWSTWIYRALTFPCHQLPLRSGHQHPAQLLCRHRRSEPRGHSHKRFELPETMSQVKTMVFDKTGTLTQGVFEVSGIHHSAIEDEKLIEYAALAECASSHPISQSLRRAYGKEIEP